MDPLSTERAPPETSPVAGDALTGAEKIDDRAYSSQVFFPLTTGMDTFQFPAEMALELETREIQRPP